MKSDNLDFRYKDKAKGKEIKQRQAKICVRTYE